MDQKKKLIEAALAARNNAYTPYSHFRVGAALLTSDGRVYTGCNIENAAFGPTNCAERTAVFKAVSEGCRSFTAIAITGGPEDRETPAELCFPCGVCRQVLREFCSDDFEVIVALDTDRYEVYTLGQMLPMSFGPDNLAR